MPDLRARDEPRWLPSSEEGAAGAGDGIDDGLYQVTTPYLCAGFVVEGGKVTRCADILRRNIDYWITKGVLVTKKKELPPVEAILRTPPITEFSGDNRWLSNFYDYTIDLKGKMFASSEHAYQTCKTRDPEWQKRIQRARSPREAKHLGYQCPLREDWDAVKVTIMRHVIAAKFPEQGALSDKLRLTGCAKLIEGNTWGDTFWGAVWDGDKWDGENMLGVLLMERRATLFGAIPF